MEAVYINNEEEEEEKNKNSKRRKREKKSMRREKRKRRRGKRTIILHWAGTCTRLKRFAAREKFRRCRALVYKSGTGCRDTDLTNHKSRIMATYSSIPGPWNEQRRKLVSFGMLINWLTFPSYYCTMNRKRSVEPSKPPRPKPSSSSVRSSYTIVVIVVVTPGVAIEFRGRLGT